ncbi:hypothetical protein C8R44DRAFT_405850 [Mycena epipterygia]|nr:hypothetical protein C8R44DRAFT_405850 [Mycena epipterygia]
MNNNYIFDCNAAYAAHGIPGILTALKDQHGTHFFDANKTFLALRTSFSEAKYSVVASFFNLSTPFADWDDLTVPDVKLPTYVIQKLVTKTIESFVSPGSIPELGNEAATGMFLSGTFQSLVCLFGGLLRDKPERSVPGTEISSGGKIEGEVFCHTEMLIFIRELKHRAQLQKKFLDSLAQVLCELFAVWHLNRRMHADVSPEKLIPVRVCLCDGLDTHFLSFDGIRFRKRSFLGHPSPIKGLNGVKDYVKQSIVVNTYTFALLLEGYHDTLRLYYERSTHRGQMGDNGTRGSHSSVTIPGIPPPMGARIDRLTTHGWYTALRFAYEARAFLQRAHALSSSEPAEKGLERLFDSLKAWPTLGQDSELILPETIEQCTEAIIQDYQMSFVQDPDPNWCPQFPGVFPLTAQADRKLAVEEFWRRMEPIYRTIFEPLTLFNGESFNTLSTFAQNPQRNREALETVASTGMVLRMMNELEISRLECHWGMVI